LLEGGGSLAGIKDRDDAGLLAPLGDLSGLGLGGEAGFEGGELGLGGAERHVGGGDLGGEGNLGGVEVFRGLGEVGLGGGQGEALFTEEIDLPAGVE